MKTRIIILAGVAVILVGVGGVSYLVHRAVQSCIGPQHVYELSERPKHLTEDLALAKARETLVRDGLNTTAWQPVREARSTDADGRTDEFVSRNTVNPNRVVVMFTNATKSARFVSVELDGSRIVCRTSIGK